jgi:hypothetical protein
MTSSRFRELRPVEAAAPLAGLRLLVALRLLVVFFVVFFVGIRGEISSGIHTVLLYSNLTRSDEAHGPHLAHHTL